MPECTICGKKSGLFSSGWVKCENCKVWYCDGCKWKLKRNIGIGPWTCVRCSGKVHG